MPATVRLVSMPHSPSRLADPPTGPGYAVRRVRRRFGADSRGVTSIEFAMVIGPFLLLVVGIMTIGLQYLTSHFIEHGVEVAARKIRTGEAQKAGVTLSGFRKLFCDEVGFMIDCDESRLVLHIKNADTFAGLMPLTNCITDGALTPSAGEGDDDIRTRTGGAGEAVVVSACYEWDMGLGLWQRVWNLVSPYPPVQGRPVLTAATAFKSEPFE